LLAALLFFITFQSKVSCISNWSDLYFNLEWVVFRFDAHCISRNSHFKGERSLYRI